MHGLIGGIKLIKSRKSIKLKRKTNFHMVALNKRTKQKDF